MTGPGNTSLTSRNCFEILVYDSSRVAAEHPHRRTDKSQSNPNVLWRHGLFKSLRRRSKRLASASALCSLLCRKNRTETRGMCSSLAYFPGRLPLQAFRVVHQACTHSHAYRGSQGFTMLNIIPYILCLCHIRYMGSRETCHLSPRTPSDPTHRATSCTSAS